MPAAKTSNAEVERELKMRLPQADLERLFKVMTKNPSVRKNVAHTFTPRSYYDTENLDLYQNDISLRVQYKTGKDGALGGYEQTVKFDLSPRKTGQKVLFRKECRNALPSYMPDLGKVSDVQAKKILKPFKNKKITHIFTIKVERRAFNVAIGHGKNASLVEVAFDVGYLILNCNKKRYPFGEIELELVNGNPSALLLLQNKIKAIARTAKTQPLTKAQQGSRLHLKHFHG